MEISTEDNWTGDTYRPYGGGLVKCFDPRDRLCVRRVKYRFSFTDPTRGEPRGSGRTRLCICLFYPFHTLLIRACTSALLVQATRSGGWYMTIHVSMMRAMMKVMICAWSRTLGMRSKLFLTGRETAILIFGWRWFSRARAATATTNFQRFTGSRDPLSVPCSPSSLQSWRRPLLRDQVQYSAAPHATANLSRIGN